VSKRIPKNIFDFLGSTKFSTAQDNFGKIIDIERIELYFVKVDLLRRRSLEQGARLQDRNRVDDLSGKARQGR
jgi:hypothetical protein